MDSQLVSCLQGILVVANLQKYCNLNSNLNPKVFHVVYFESSQDMEMGDVDLSDILLAIARRVRAILSVSRGVRAANLI
jgi:hypothetical protein